jgi:uncharacterized tellurite resistance protein B-like protein
MTPSPSTYWFARFVAGTGLLFLAGLGWPGRFLGAVMPLDEIRQFDFLVGVCGFWLAVRAVAPLVALTAARAQVRREWGHDVHDAFERASLGRRVFFLLLGIAEADGRAGSAERQVVRQFLLERFVDPISHEDLRTWAGQVPPTHDLAALATVVARHLPRSERDSLFFWCCLVSLADGGLSAAEQRALAAAAHGLGLQPAHARSLYHLADEHHRRRGFHAGGGTTAGPDPFARRPQPGDQAGDRRRSESPRPHTPLGDRERALAILDLPRDATPESIRKRHRELVRKFHPDAQPNLGQVAQQEATERFREIQRAYEILTA